jgi:hypothetical protein
MVVTILQPAFIPWTGYFAMMELSDVFILYDDVQFFRWFVNRNKLLIKGEAKWISIPVQTHRKKINETLVAIQSPPKYLQTIATFYGKSPFYKETLPLIEQVFKLGNNIGDIAINSILLIKNYLGIRTTVVKSSDLNIYHEDKSMRLVEICKRFKASKYLTGPSSISYINKDYFLSSNIELKIFKYAQIPYYQYGSSKFIANLSILDMLINLGVEATKNNIKSSLGNCLFDI